MGFRLITTAVRRSSVRIAGVSGNRRGPSEAWPGELAAFDASIAVHVEIDANTTSISRRQTDRCPRLSAAIKG